MKLLAFEDPAENYRVLADENLPGETRYDRLMEFQETIWLKYEKIRSLSLTHREKITTFFPRMK